jgi:hypothetical protein
MNLWSALTDIVWDLIDPPFRVSYFDHDPDPRELGPRTFAIVGSPKLRKYAHFRCPCGCRDVIVLSDNPTLRPRWTFTPDTARRPTVVPSVWRTKGCRSHFLIQRGRIIWVSSVGEPLDARKTIIGTSDSFD